MSRSLHTRSDALPLVAACALVALVGACTDNELQELAPDVFVAPDEVDFGTVTVGVASEQTIAVHNVGGGTLHVDSVTLLDGTVGFAVEDFAGGLAAEDVVELTVTFAPEVTGPADDVIRVVSDDPDEPAVSVPVFAVDVVDAPVPMIAWSPPSLDFGAVPSGGTPALTVTVTSVGTADLDLSAVTLDPTTSDAFTITADPSPAVLPPGHATSVEVTYAPSEEVPDAGVLHLASDDPDTPDVEVPLSGELLPAADIELVPTQLLFGAVEVGDMVVMEAEVWSLGDADLEIGTLIQTGSAEFELLDDVSGVTLPPGEMAVVSVAYTPVDASADSGAIEFPSNDPDEPVATLQLAGQYDPVPDIEVQPASLDFGLVDQGLTATDSVLVSNVGTGDLWVEAPALGGSTDFSLAAAQFPCSIAPGASELLIVTYAPADLVSDSGEITITSDDPDEPTVVVPLLGAAEPAPDIDLQPTMLQFGAVQVGQTSTMSATITNLGTEDLELYTLALSGAADFTLSVDPSGATLAPGASTPVEVTYAPTNPGMDTGQVAIPSNDPDEPMVYLLLSGSEQPIPDIVVTPLSLDFGEIDQGLSGTHTVQVSNVGGADLTVTGLSLAGSAEFSQTSLALPGTLAPGAQALVYVTYAPTDEVADAGTLTVASDDPDEPAVDVELLGAPTPVPDIDLVPTALAFGAVPLGTTLSLDAEVWNVGTGDLTLGALSQTGSADFALAADPSGAVVAPGSYVVVAVDYTPSDLLADVGQIRIPSDDPDEPLVTLSLSGEHDPIPDIDVDPLLVDLGVVDLGQTSSATVTVTNVGSGDLTVDLPTLAGSGDLSLNAGAFPATIGPNGSRTMTVYYAPSDWVADSATITVTSDDPDEPVVTVDVIGSATPEPDIDVTPTALQFGQVLVGGSLALTANVANVGSADLTLSTLSISGTSEFSITVDPSGAVLAPGASTPVEVTYAPANTGSDSATLEIPSDDPDEPLVSVTLVGADEPVPDIDVDPLLVDFGVVPANQSQTDTVLVANVGTAALSVTAVTLAGSNEFAFNVGGLPGSINPGQDRTIYVTYAPSDELADVATLTIASDDPDEPSVIVDLLGEPAPQPDIDVDPLLVDFGDVKINDTAYDWVTIFNVGDADLDLYSCIPDGDPEFGVVSNPGGTVVAPGGFAEMEVRFNPHSAGSYYGWVDIASNDPDEGIVSVDLVGDGAAPQIELDPAQHGFGNVGLGCYDTVDVAIRSVGTVPLTLYGYSWWATPMTGALTLDSTELDDHLALGVDLQPGDELTVTVDFAPDAMTSYDGLLTVTSDDPSDPSATAAQAGDGVAGGYTTDTFTQSGNNWTDVLWVIDNSCSMGDEQGQLADDFTSFYGVIHNAGVDYRLAVATTDDEDFQGSPAVIDQNTPNGGQQFAANCLVGTGGSGTERGLLYGHDALVDAANGTYPNTGFWRDDAALRVVFVSDEPDQSGSWSTYLSYYQGMKADPDMVVLSAIVGTDGYNAVSCSGPGGNADPGSGYVDVANATGGVLGSICAADWSTVLTNLAWISVNLEDTFYLSQTAIAGTIEVYVNGVLYNSGWSHDAALNAVVFAANALPQSGDTVEIEYGYYGPC